MRNRIFVFSVILLLTTSAFTQSLVPNKAFGISGSITTNINNDYPAVPGHVIRQPDGKIIIAGDPITRILPDGTPDSSFENDGAVILPYSEEPLTAVLQQDGKIVVMYASYQDGFKFARITADGNPDSSYGNNGFVSISPNGLFPTAITCIIQPDDKVVFTGVDATDNIERIITGRLLPSGVLDSSFSGNGFAELEYVGESWQTGAIGLQADGSIIIAGTYHAGPSAGYFKIVRFNSNGLPDISFNDGSISFEYPVMGTDIRISDLKILHDGTILTCGNYNNSVIALKLKNNGSADSSFNGRGIYTRPAEDGTFYSGNIYAKADGKILIVGLNITTGSGSVQRDYMLLQLNGDGTSDLAFGNSGRKVLSVDQSDFYISSLLLPDESLLIAGMTGEWHNITLIKLSADASLDNTFGDNGIKTLRVMGTNESVNDILVQPDKKVIAVGRKDPLQDNESAIAVVRYNAGGRSLDSSFGSNGKVRYPESFHLPSDLTFRSAALQSDGKIVIGAYSRDWRDYGYRNMIFRLNSDGTPDSSFGINYAYVSPHSSPLYFLCNIAVTTDDKIIACQNDSFSGQNFSVTRLHRDGRIDSSFGINGERILQTDNEKYFVNALTLQADNKLVISSVQNIGNEKVKYALMRLLPNGNFDSSFGAQGITTFPDTCNLSGIYFQTRVDKEGKIIGIMTNIKGNLGSNTSESAVFKLKSNGEFDSSFNGRGILSLPRYDSFLTASFTSLLLHPDSSIYIMGIGNFFDYRWQTFLMRIKNNGTIDSSIDYKKNGIMFLNTIVEIVLPLSLGPDSSILIGGSYQVERNLGSDFFLSSYKKLKNGYHFTGNGNWSDALNWENNLIPPMVLPSNNFISIDPANGGSCILNRYQQVSSGSYLIIEKNKEFEIVGGLFNTN